MLLCLRKPPVRFLWCCCSHFIFDLRFVVVLHLSMFLFIFSFRHHPSPFRGLSRGFYTHFILSAQPIPEWFATLSFSTIPLSSCRERYGLEWAFFTLCSFTNILTYVYQGFPGSRQFFLEVWRTSYRFSKHKPSPSLCLIHSNQQSSYSERFSFKLYHILSWIACGGSLIYLLLTRFELFLLVQSHM